MPSKYYRGRPGITPVPGGAPAPIVGAEGALGAVSKVVAEIQGDVFQQAIAKTEQKAQEQNAAALALQTRTGKFTPTALPPAAQEGSLPWAHRRVLAQGNYARASIERKRVALAAQLTINTGNQQARGAAVKQLTEQLKAIGKQIGDPEFESRFAVDAADTILNAEHRYLTKQRGIALQQAADAQEEDNAQLISGVTVSNYGETLKRIMAQRDHGNPAAVKQADADISKLRKAAENDMPNIIGGYLGATAAETRKNIDGGMHEDLRAAAYKAAFEEAVYEEGLAMVALQASDPVKGDKTIADALVKPPKELMAFGALAEMTEKQVSDALRGVITPRRAARERARTQQEKMTKARMEQNKTIGENTIAQAEKALGGNNAALPWEVNDSAALEALENNAKHYDTAARHKLVALQFAKSPVFYQTYARNRGDGKTDDDKMRAQESVYNLLANDERFAALPDESKDEVARLLSGYAEGYIARRGNARIMNPSYISPVDILRQTPDGAMPDFTPVRGQPLDYDDSAQLTRILQNPKTPDLIVRDISDLLMDNAANEEGRKLGLLHQSRHNSGDQSVDRLPEDLSGFFAEYDKLKYAGSAERRGVIAMQVWRGKMDGTDALTAKESTQKDMRDDVEENLRKRLAATGIFRFDGKGRFGNDRIYNNTEYTGENETAAIRNGNAGVYAVAETKDGKQTVVVKKDTPEMKRLVADIESGAAILKFDRSANGIRYTAVLNADGTPYPDKPNQMVIGVSEDDTIPQELL